jgi:23S rRNA (guanine2445-N2)-methyltransferase / 23S rRNA (guanine2069-N7)-methyltransferase
METTYSFFATTPKGVESILVNELENLGAEEVKETRAGASFSGGFVLGYKACLWLRTVNRVFLVLDSFKAETIEDLYDGIRNIDWSDHMSPESTLAVDFNSNQSIIRHTHFGALKVKDAIVDQFREKYSIRPSVETSLPDIRINVFMNRRDTTVSLDLSGSSLHKRGYRNERGLAPLKENLAAAILIKSGWPEIAKNGGSFIDPMCGSGTLPIEAAMIAGNMAPGLLREYFGFLKWRQHQPGVWQMLVDEAEDIEMQQRPDVPPVIGFDRDSGAIKDSIANLESAGLHGLVHFEKRPLTELIPHPKTIDKPGLLAVNPPYGERLGKSDELKQLYSRLGKRLRSYFKGWQIAVFTGNSKLAEVINIKPARTDKFFNGSIPCDLIQYRLSSDPAEAQVKSPRLFHGQASEYHASDEIKTFENRIKKNLKKLKPWRTRNNISCFRVYDRDIPEYAVAVDIYDQWIHVQEYKAPKSISAEIAFKRLKDIVYTLPSLLDVPDENVFLKQRQKQKRTNQYERQSDHSKTALVKESDLLFEINLESYIDTGLFLDHRLTRTMIERMAPGKRFLNLFSYTATATVYAARGGAVSTTSVDKSNTYTRWAKKNMRLNGFDQSCNVFYSADCMDWIKKEKSRYDLIFLDPPTFSNTKKTGSSLDIQKDHVNLILSTVKLLADDGTLIFSNNYRNFKMDFNRLSLLQIEDITSSTIPPDYERNPKIHNCWLIRH